MPVTSMLNKLHGQPASYEKKSVLSCNPLLSIIPAPCHISNLDGALDAPQPHRTPAENNRRRSKYRFGRTLGAGTYGIVKEADSPEGKVAVKIILKKNVKGNDQMVYDELDMLQRLHHPHIVKFCDWFESRDKYYIVTQLATGGELFDRICDRGRFTEKDASSTIRQVLEAVAYLHQNDVVHRGLSARRNVSRSMFILTL